MQSLLKKQSDQTSTNMMFVASALLLALTAGFLVMASISGNVAAAPLPDVIRTGGPSYPKDAKVAVLVSKRSYIGVPFTITNEHGIKVFTGHLNKAAHPEPWAFAATADFSSLTQPGQHRVHVKGLVSRPWRVNSTENTKLVAKLMGFFRANRDGYEYASIHKPSHLNDAQVNNGHHKGKHVELTGGWMDAGDQLHFTQTTAYTAIILQVAAKLDPYNAKLLRSEADVGIRWLLKAHPFPDSYIGQVGDTRDHDTDFRDPATDDHSKLAGIAYRQAYPTDSSSIMAKTAAALALAAERNAGRAKSQLLREAVQWYRQGRIYHSAGKPLPGKLYYDVTWQDDMSFAAAMLWRLTGKTAYLSEAMQYLAHSYDDRLGTPAISVMTAADLCGVLGHAKADVVRVRNTACAYLRQAALAAMKIAEKDNAPWGTPGEFLWGHSANNGAGGAVIALAKRAGLVPQATYAARARDWLLGLNPWGASMVVGYGVNSPTTPHHWASVMGSGLPQGAVVGGPASMAELAKNGFSWQGPFNSKRAAYSRTIGNYITSEPALDYSVNSVFLLASLSALHGN